MSPFYGTRYVPREKLKLELWRRGIRQGQVARLLKTTDTSVTRFLRGEQNFNEERKYKIARLLGMEFSELFCEGEGTTNSIEINGGVKLESQ